MIVSLPAFVRVVSVLSVCALVLSSAGAVFAATYSITITDDQFVPSTLKITEGDSITFINSTDATQSAKTSSSTGFNTGNIGAGASKTVTLSQAGTFSYSSTQDSTLTGTVTVEASGVGGASSSATTTTTKGGDMPVSGTTEVLMGMIALGAGFIALGSLSNRFAFARTEDSVVELQPLSSSRSPDQE